MCGITGQVNFTSGIQKDIFLKSIDAIRYRGPDSSGYFTDKSVALGIRRLRIIDLETGDQPISNEDGNITVVFNGEIYNFLELKRELVLDGHKFKTQSDTEVLTHLYEKYGSDMPKYLNGMFAFALWDKKKQVLFIARDHVGIKPLYFWVKDSELIFGSELKTILSYPQVILKVSTNSLYKYAFFGYIPGEHSIYEKIQKLLPGHSITFSKGGIKIKKFHNIKFNQPTDKLSLEFLLMDSIKRQSVADVPLGVLLSGGLDSTLIVYFLSHISSKIKTFSIAFKEQSFDESYFAKEVSKIFGTVHHQEYFSPSDIKNSFGEISSRLDEPLADPSLFPTFKVCRMTRKHVTVALSGDGGDELFGGYQTYQGHILAESFQPVSKILSVLGPLFKMLPVSNKNYPIRDSLLKFLGGLDKAFVERHFFWMSIFSGQQLHLQGSESFLNSYKKIKIDDQSKLCRYLDFKTYLMDDLLVKVDRASMYNSLEVRVPILDPRIVDYAFSTSHPHFDLFTTKKMFRKILHGHIPDYIVNRKKKGFGLPLSSWLKSDLKDLAFDMLQNRSLEVFFSKAEISKIWQQHQSGRENNAKIIWMLVMLGAWFKNWQKP